VIPVDRGQPARQQAPGAVPSNHSSMSDGRHIPALDGVRGLALVAVLAYHANPSWLPGAPLAITVFFTLSGFLITSLIVREIETTGRLDLRAFWLRRARRLVPGSIAAVVLVAVLVAAGGRVVTPTLVGDAVSALTWTANWRFVAEGSTYESLFADPSPFQHFWSLAIEEQVYLLLPLAALLLLGRSGRHRLRFGLVAVAGIGVSTWLAMSLAAGGGIGGHAYYGTEARLAEPLVGAVLALVLTRRDGFARLNRTMTVVADAAGWFALAGLALLMATLSVGDPRLYRGGFLAGAVLAALVVVAASQDTWLAKAFAFRPLIFLGLISYAAYLFHWPLYQWIDPAGTATPALVAAEVAVTIALAYASTTLLEQPIRRRRTRTVRIFATGWANASVAALAVLVVASTVSVPGTAATRVDLGAGVDDAVPPPPVVAGAVDQPAAPLAPPPPEQQAMGAPSGGPAPTEGGSEPVTPEEEDILEGDGWAEGHVDDAPSADGRLRVAVVGDSLAHNLATGLSAWADSRGDVVVYDLSVSFCPLSRGGERRWQEGSSFPVHAGCSWWADSWTERARGYAAFAPDVVVSAAAISEMLDRRLPEWEDWQRPGDPPYHRWLIQEYQAMFDALRTMAGGATRFVSLNAPCGDFERVRGWRHVEEPDERIGALNEGVYPLMIGASNGDLFGELCPDGQFTEDLWGIDGARPDGMHLTDEAATELAHRWLGPLVLEAAQGLGVLMAAER